MLLNHMYVPAGMLKPLKFALIELDPVVVAAKAWMRGRTLLKEACRPRAAEKRDALANDAGICGSAACGIARCRATAVWNPLALGPEYAPVVPNTIETSSVAAVYCLHCRTAADTLRRTKTAFFAAREIRRMCSPLFILIGLHPAGRRPKSWRNEQNVCFQVG